MYASVANKIPTITREVEINRVVAKFARVTMSCERCPF